MPQEPLPIIHKGLSITSEPYNPNPTQKIRSHRPRCLEMLHGKETDLPAKEHSGGDRVVCRVTCFGGFLYPKIKGLGLRCTWTLKTLPVPGRFFLNPGPKPQMRSPTKAGCNIAVARRLEVHGLEPFESHSRRFLGLVVVGSTGFRV